MSLSLRSSDTTYKMPAIAAALFCSLLLLLPGCGIPKLRNALAARELPPSFNGMDGPEGSSSAQVGIDEFFDDPILVDLIDSGLNNNLQLKMLAEDIQIANNEILKRSGAYLPFLTAGAGASLTKYSQYTIEGADNLLDPLPGTNGGFPSPYPNFMVAADFSWQIDIWRQLRNSRDAAGLKFLATCEGRNYVVTRLVAEIAESYYGLMALDMRLENLNRIISLQEESLLRAKALKVGAQGTELGVQRFVAEVKKNQSELLIIKQDIIETENRVNFLAGRFPQPVQRQSAKFYDLTLHQLSLGVPAELLQNRPDIRQSERELAAAGLDIKVARANFYPRLLVNSEVGYSAFNTKYLILTPESLIYSVAGDLTAPLINKRAIKAEYMSANAKQLQALYDYQRTVLNAFTEVINRITKVQNYNRSIEIKKQQLEALESAVDFASKLFQSARVQYMDVLFAQRDLADARMVLISTKREQLSAIVNTYQALGGGLVQFSYPEATFVPTELPLPPPGAPAEAEPAAVPPTPDGGAKDDD